MPEAAVVPEVWVRALRKLQAALPGHDFEHWIKPLSAALAGEQLLLRAPGQMHCNRVRLRYLRDLRRALADDAQARALTLRIEVDTAPHRTARSVAAPAAVAATPRPTPPPSRATGDKERSAVPREPAALARLGMAESFQTFVVGDANKLAREATLAIAEGREPLCCPLYLVGPTGSGKSHLASALVRELRRRGDDRHTLHCSAESFTSQFTRALRNREMDAFQHRFRRQCRLLVLEDLQFFEGKKATQLELFHTVEHLLQAGARAVLTANCLPREIPGFDERLTGQLSSGLVAGLDAPDRTLRRNILRAKAAHGGVRVPDDCIEALVDGCTGSVRDLVGSLKQVVISASLLGRPIDRELVEQALRQMTPATGTALGVDDVLDCVCNFFGVKASQLRSRSRARSVLLPRQLAMYLCHRYTDSSLSEIGRHFGRQHPAVANAVRKVEREILERPQLRYRVEELAQRLEVRGAGAPRPTF